MNIDNKAWLTLDNKNFNADEYLYHFTSIEKANLILYGDCLKFAKISNLNDTIEAKPKIDLKYCPANIEYINQNYMQLLCFSRDIKDYNIDDDFNNNNNFISDYTGRGFALPRMWAQYANDNDGICFVFNKSLLLEECCRQLYDKTIMFGNVDYISKYKKINTHFDETLFFRKLKNNEILSFFKSNTEFTKINYFYKLKDWENEHEFRILAFGKNDHYIKNIRNALVGIIIGEKIKPTDKKIIELFCNNMFEIKKINFSHIGCTLETIYD